MDWAKIMGYVGLLYIIIAVLAQMIASVAPNYHELEQSDAIIRWSIYLWAYAVVVTGIYLKKKTGQFLELLISLLVSTLCLINWLTVPVTLIYFFRAFAKLNKINNSLPF